MSRFVLSANLPACAETLLIGEKYAELLRKSLEKLEISPIFVPDNPNIDPRLSGHVDLSVLHTGGEGIFLAPYLRGSAMAESLRELGADIRWPEIVQARDYPHDAQLNLCMAGRTVFYNSRSASNEIVNHFTSNGAFEMLDGRQGYARCSICVADDRAVICADRGLYELALRAGFDALLISAGHIELSGYAYGFIGGASFKLSRKRMAFTGRLDGHPDRDRILEFLSAHGIEPVYLTELPVFDIGSAIPLTEK